MSSSVETLPDNQDVANVANLKGFKGLKRFFSHAKI